MPTGTVRLHRVFPVPPERVYRAFLTAEAMAKWLPPYGYVCKVDHLDARVGGTFRMSFENFANRQTQPFGGEFRTLTENETIEYSDKFDDPNLPGEMVTRVRLRAVSVGVDVDIEQSGIPEAIPVEMCYLGWQQSLAQLEKLVVTAGPDAP